MPDWSYHSIFKPLLFKLPPKKARDVTFGALNLLSRFPFGSSVIAFFGHMEPPAEIKKSILGVEFFSPVGLNGRLDPDLASLRAMTQFGFGYITVGPVTLKPVKEEQVRRDVHQEEIGYERLDANSGLEATYKCLSTLNKNGSKLMVRVRYEGNFYETCIIIDRLLAIADLFIIEGIDEDSTFRKLKERYSFLPLLIGAQTQCAHIASELLQMEPDGIVLDDLSGTPNTGYRVGKESKTRCLDVIRHLRKENRTIPIIASGGVTEPQDALDLLDAGANLIQVHSGLVYSGPGLPKRINEALAARSRTTEVASFKEWGWLFLMGLGVFLAGIIAMVFALTSVILPYDENFLGLTKEQLRHINPKILEFMSHDRNTLAGVMISAGFLYMQLAYYGIRKKVHWARKAFVIAGVLGFLNFFYFIGFGYFDLLHFVYNMLLLPFFIAGLLCSRTMRKGESGVNVLNHPSWKRSQIGQLCFVVIGFSLLLGGIVISVIGMTTVFVPTDLLFLQLGPEEIIKIDPKLIPLIAHDRAGFGGALLSEGFLLLCISLWGFREGEKWIWWTFFFGGLPGFIAGIGTHFHIGYTDFVHLLPAYFLVALYVIGLLYSFNYLHKREPIKEQI
ncbi:dihydroorotate dehydrogenase [Halalkalibacter urbisdiaboli]|uniref:dihydroorotate dehydrogenase n=1 Tax=Halalkalibacter urbisdiaboli TaxID=1960589 RepID=UPI0013FD8157|nr:dihydroorotate dehydrogenase [Halalkalibacter urbisdiaboli]